MEEPDNNGFFLEDNDTQIFLNEIQKNTILHEKFTAVRAEIIVESELTNYRSKRTNYFYPCN